MNYVQWFLKAPGKALSFPQLPKLAQTDVAHVAPWNDRFAVAQLLSVNILPALCHITVVSALEL